MNLDEAISIAKTVRQNSYAPHSKYFVGAALKGKSGKIYSGCNIENDGIMSICAERVAFTKAISEGEKEFEYIVICGGSSLDTLENCTPCGYCRQFISEFVDKDFKIYLLSPDNKVSEYTIGDLLPHNFNL
jgi:cytidine deaminase